MEKEFVTYTQSLALKELGFDEPCFGYYDNGVFIFWYDSKQETELLLNCSAPLKQQVFRWFREKLSEAIIEGGFRSGQSAKYTTYEEAELACINELIEIIKNK